MCICVSAYKKIYTSFIEIYSLIISVCECAKVYSPTNWYHRALRFKDPIEGAAMAFIHTLPVLDGKNYDQWVVRMEVILGIVKEGNSEKEKEKYQ